MQVYWWSCLCVICMPSEALINSWTVNVNSSTEIKCLILQANSMGIYLHRGFHDKKDVVFLQMINGQVAEMTTSTDFKGRIQVSQVPLVEGGYGITWQLSHLRPEDTNWYYCKWLYPVSKMMVSETSMGTIIIVREGDTQEQCRIGSVMFIFITLSVVAILCLLVAGAVVRCTRFKRRFVPARAA